MRRTFLIIAALAGYATIAPAAVPPGIYTNEEQAYFTRAPGQPAPKWMGLRVDGGMATPIDAFGQPTGPAIPTPGTFESDTLTLSNGTKLQRARPATCWVAILRDKPKPDGSEDWYFKAGLKLHDVGGRARAGGDGVRALTLRMRNVVFPSGPNRPSLVLYVHESDPDRATAYSWADRGASRVGLNLRWMQASCTIDGAAEEKP